MDLASVYDTYSQRLDFTWIRSECGCGVQGLFFGYEVVDKMIAKGPVVGDDASFEGAFDVPDAYFDGVPLCWCYQYLSSAISAEFLINSIS